MNTKLKITALLSVVSFGAFAQEDSLKMLPLQINPNLKITGYIETYYAYDFNEPENNTRPPFFYSHNRHNEVALNLGFIKAAYDNGKVRSNLALMAGTYANANLAAEEGVLKNVFEANAGVKLAKDANLWIDAGIFASHIGFESAIGKDCWTLTRSILADNSPYYEAGAKISYTSPSGEWFVSGLVLNGWQRIQRPDGNKTIAFGHQLTYRPNAKVTLNSSSFVGNDKPEADKRMRYFHNFYGQFQLSDKFGLIAGFDIGAEQKAKGSESYNAWYSPVLIAQYRLSDKIAVAVRGEYYSDENGVIIATGTENGFKTFGYSANFDYNIYSNVVWRVEARSLNSKDDIFIDGEDATANNTFVTTALAISF
ncbi:outer membrane beta-barrel protein [Flavobacterium sp. D11R37]|uniref:porin n=1 Tax=Flavobacterium coralii TaxID=2838017 RepID=UPI001CA69FD7|nr:porin [Flavobacterium coralii]MBY8961509.1 outer membrane beta-barrel protein [Flavobacterium coralii]